MLIPAPSGACKDCACRCLRRGAWYQHPAWQRSAPGRVALVLEGLRSRRPAVTVAVEAPAMAAECGDRREAHGRRRARKSRQPAAACSGAQNRRHAGAARQPRGPPRSQRAPQEGSQAGPAGLAGAGGQPAPGRREAPAYPSRLAPPPAARERNGACATTRSSRHHGKPKRSRAGSAQARAGSAQARAGSAQAPDPLRPEPRPVLQPLPGVLCRLSRYAQGLDDRCAAAHPRRTA